MTIKVKITFINIHGTAIVKRPAFHSNWQIIEKRKLESEKPRVFAQKPRLKMQYKNSISGDGWHSCERELNARGGGWYQKLPRHMIMLMIAFYSFFKSHKSLAKEIDSYFVLPST